MRAQPKDPIDPNPVDRDLVDRYPVDPNPGMLPSTKGTQRVMDRFLQMDKAHLDEYGLSMAYSESTSTTFTPERTFRSYGHAQGVNYAQNRPTYHPNLYKTIVNHHLSTGGELITILDVGCGPGNAVRDLAPQFVHAVGLDPSEGMISAARSLGGVTSNLEPICFELSTAEDLAQNSRPIPDSSIDLIIAATAAHWFDMVRFWPRAAQVLKPGGTVAFWTGGGSFLHPSMPNNAAIQAAISEIEEQHLKPYIEQGSLLAENLYTDLLLPWSLPVPSSEFDQASFYRKDWNEAIPCSGCDQFFAWQDDPHYLALDLQMTERVLGTRGGVTRWREAHPENAGTELDVVKIICKEIERLLHEAGVKRGEEVVKMGVKGVLLMVKKRSGPLSVMI